MWHADSSYSLFRSSIVWGFGRGSKAMDSSVWKLSPCVFILNLLTALEIGLMSYVVLCMRGLPLDFSLFLCIGWVGEVELEQPGLQDFSSISTYFSHQLPLVSSFQIFLERKWEHLWGVDIWEGAWVKESNKPFDNLGERAFQVEETTDKEFLSFEKAWCWVSWEPFL